MRPTTTGLFSIKWYYGDILIKDNSGWVEDYLIGHAVTSFPYYNGMGCGFALNKPSDIYRGDTCYLSQQYPIVHEPCVSPGWVTSFEIAISITEGAEYGEFQTASGVSLGSSFTCYLGGINTIHYRANGEEPDSSGMVSIRATSGSIVSETSFKVQRVQLYIDAQISGGRMYLRYQDTQFIETYFRDGSGALVPPTRTIGKTLTYDIVRGSEYGTLRNEITGEMGAHLSDVPKGKYSMRFMANGARPDEDQEVLIRISSNDETIEPVELTFIVTLELQICPELRFTKKELSIGDTTQITVMGRFPNGTYTPYIYQCFDLQLMGPAGACGMLVATNGTSGSSLHGVDQPMKYIAPEEISGDSLVVPIAAAVADCDYGEGGGPGSVRQKDTLRIVGLSLAKKGEINSLGSKEQVFDRELNADKTDSLQSSRLSQETKSPSLLAVLAGEECSIASVTVKSLDHFDVRIVPDTVATADTIAFTEGAKLIIQAQDKDSVDIEYDGSTLLKFSLTTNEEYGTFIKANGDTLKTTPVELTNILYSDAKAGKIKFAAVKKNPDSVVTCRIRVEKQIDTTKHGEKDAVVVEQTLKIVMDQPYQVRPSQQKIQILQG
jgi:hypothetical protein